MRIDLSGKWNFRLDQEVGWRPTYVPGCWEQCDVPKNHPGPVWYHRRIDVPAEFTGMRLWLRFGAVSYACEVFVNGRPVGSHVGMWDGFSCEVTSALVAGQHADVLVRVEKPASLTAGPQSPHLAGRYPQKQTLSGFLPYVWGHCFGGIWQGVWLEATGAEKIDEFVARGNHRGRVQVQAKLSGAARAELTLLGPDGEVLEHMAPPDPITVLDFSGGLKKHVKARPWCPESPTLYEARLRIEGGDERTIRFGMRTVRAEGSALLLNEQPVYPRMILSWGWHEQIAPLPSHRAEQIRRDFRRLMEMGFNGVKLCLWVPPAWYFDIADEMGMLLWLELPMWMPEVTPFFIQQTPVEYERIVRQVRHHPSVVLYTLGCELDASVKAGFLEPLYRQTKALIGDALLRDNSGSGEAYGGLLNEFAEFYDYHFYSDIQFLRPLLDLFAPRWRPEQPFFFGEFCDSDTWRDLRKLFDTDECIPWWASNDDQVNPQGARWQIDLPKLELRVRAAGLWNRQDQLVAVSHRQALLHRKFTLELVRTYREISGYAVTGERDTPISSAGVLADGTPTARGETRAKLPPEVFRKFNGDIALSLGWDRRRDWTHGGDRAVWWDTFSYTPGNTVRAHLIASNYGRVAGAGRGSWRVETVEGDPLSVAEGLIAPVTAPPPGDVREVAIAEFVVPDVDRPTRAVLRAEFKVGQASADNEWPLWLFPKPADPAAVRLVDPSGRLDDHGPWLRFDDDAGVTLATVWSEQLAQFVAAGGRAILLQAGRGSPGPLPTEFLPFWREGIKLIEAHPAWGDFPHEGFCDLQFFGMATDVALKPLDGELVSQAARETRPQRAVPILRRVDARTAAVHDYAVELEIGRGRLIVTTLQFAGGLGEQPTGLARNTSAAYLLGCWVRYLSSSMSRRSDAKPEQVD